MIKQQFQNSKAVTWPHFEEVQSSPAGWQQCLAQSLQISAGSEPTTCCLAPASPPYLAAASC